MSTWNHVVISSVGWGRGESHEHAISNANFDMNYRHSLYHFKNDKWDIFSDGMLSYNLEDLIKRTQFKGGKPVNNGV